MGSATGDCDVPMIASHPSPASEISDDKVLDTGRKRGNSFALLPSELAGPGSGLTSFCGA